MVAGTLNYQCVQDIDIVRHKFTFIDVNSLLDLPHTEDRLEIRNASVMIIGSGIGEVFQPQPFCSKR